MCFSLSCYNAVGNFSTKISKDFYIQIHILHFFVICDSPAILIYYFYSYFSNYVLFHVILLYDFSGYLLYLCYHQSHDLLSIFINKYWSFYV